VLNNASNPIQVPSRYQFIWSVSDSIGRQFTTFSSNMTTMTINYGLLLPNNIYTICVAADSVFEKVSGSTCSKYKTYGDSNLFTFSVQPTSGFAFTTQFVFTAANTQVLSQQYFFEYGYLSYKLSGANVAIDQTYIPFETSSPVLTKSFKLQPPQPGQANMVRVYAKVTSEIGERYMYFQDVSVTVAVQNATWVGDTIRTVSFDSLNEVFTKVTQVSMVADAIPIVYKATVLRTLVSAIANITNATIGSLITPKGRLLQAGLGIGSRVDDTFT
jgi:hypothetical protein